MIDIQGDLLQIKQQREQTYISIVELLDFLKKQSPNSSFKDIAKWLLVKLELNDSRNVDLFSCTDHENWEYEYEIPNFCVPLEIEDKPVELPSSSFFDALREIGDVPLFGRGISSYDYLPIDKSDIFLERSRIEKFLGFSTINNASNEIFIEKNCAIEKAQNTQLQAENERLKAENAELKAQLQDNAQRQSAVDSESVLENGKATRISKIQRDIFTLLILKNYQGMESRNALFDVINADLKEQGINNKGASYQTFDNLIDENIRLTKIGLDGKQISHSPFPSKITK
ncbi:hypothetical protein [Haemophilus haemolyticus]|uniref:hypothetical protein n=1 Tax=Haemophilus haemolyticus TaxID=726 RepID=UPI000E58C23B|nr:hypothetical protein [Haemophilus haemolyticus]